MTSPIIGYAALFRAGRGSFRWPVAAALAGLIFGTAPVTSAQVSTPPPVTVRQSNGPLADGLIFISPQGGGAKSSYAVGPEIIDNRGRTVWFSPIAGGSSAADFRVQSYQGKPVLTWSQGVMFNATPPVTTVDYILDDTYNVVATVTAGNGLNADQHTFLLTPQNTALITIYHLVSADLSAVGGAVDGKVYEGVVQEIDVATGRVLFEWHSLPDVPVTDSYQAPPASGSSGGYDYFHLNSVSVDTDGNLLVSARHTWAVYKLNRTTGAVMWRLGGKRNDFTYVGDVGFAYQHDANAAGPDALRIFDNESNGTPVWPYSRVIWVQLDTSAMTATLTAELKHPDNLCSAFTGNAQQLDNGNVFVGWGSTGRISEFDPTGNLLFDASLPGGCNTYRAFRLPWTGRPTTKPDATFQANDDGTMTVHGVWNGATGVATWQVLEGNSPNELSVAEETAWNGYDTAFSQPVRLPYVQVVALGADGTRLGFSAIHRVSFGFDGNPSISTLLTDIETGFYLPPLMVANPGMILPWNF